LTDLAKFIRGLPRGSKVMVAYIRGGSLNIRQRFTDDLERAASSLRVVSGSAGGASGPYDGLSDTLNFFESQPAGRRAVLLVSDGLDGSPNATGFGPVLSPELDRAILRAQRRSVAVYSIYSPAALTQSGDSRIVTAGQGALQRLADETGGRPFFQGSLAPISFVPFLRDLGILLDRQFALTYLSTHMKKGYHRVEVKSTNPEVKIEHPKGYYYR
jgi:VWFA-related protein